MSGVQFLLTGLNSTTTLTQAPAFPAPASASRTVTGHTFDLAINIGADKFGDITDPQNNSVFWFNTTNPDLSSDNLTDDMEFFTKSAHWPDISFSEGIITGSGNGGEEASENIIRYASSLRTVSGNHILKRIGPAKLAKDITGGYNNSDIFSNEGELIAQYENLDSALKTQIISNLDAAGQAGVPGIGGADGAGGDGVAAGLGRKTNNDTGVDNISREVFLQLAANSFDRIRDQLAYHQGLVDNADNNYGYDIPMPLQAGDALQFTIKYKSNDADDPNNPGGNITYPGSNTIHDQIFKVTLNIT